MHLRRLRFGRSTFHELRKIGDLIRPHQGRDMPRQPGSIPLLTLQPVSCPLHLREVQTGRQRPKSRRIKPSGNIGPQQSEII